MYQRMLTLGSGLRRFSWAIEPARNADGSGVAVIYWKDRESIAAFARDPEHLVAKQRGREIWYSH